MAHILGIDAGGTKTNAAIATESGEIIGEASAGPANFHTQSVNDFRATLIEVIQGAALAANLDRHSFEAVCLGIAGLDTEPQIQDARELLLNFIPVQDAEKLLVVNDVQLVRPSCATKPYGIAAIVGTGSNFYGTNKKGEEALAGGLDYLLADEGSGYWIGLKVLQAVTRAADGRGPHTALEDLVKARFSIPTVRDLADVVYRDSFGKRDVAEVGMLIDDGFKKGDGVATAILEEAAAEIALAINALITQLGMEEDGSFDIVATGGVLRSPFPFKEKISSQLINKKAELIFCSKKPVEGAIALAKSTLSASSK